MTHHLVVIGASAGGIKALIELFKQLPSDFNAAILVVLHISNNPDNVLTKILGKHSALPVVIPTDLQEVKPGVIYVAPPSVHMSLVDGKIALRFGPKINHSRPAIDPLFYSAALFYGPLAIGIILTGLLDDGAAGLLAIKKCHGTMVVQSPTDAEYPSMPENAIKTSAIDYTVPISQMGALLEYLLTSQNEKSLPKERWGLLEIESKMNFIESVEFENHIHKIACPSMYSCPACNGVLWEINDKQLPRYRCYVGHAYGETDLSNEFDKTIERYLWQTLRAYEEKQQFLQKNLKDEQDLLIEDEVQTILQKIKIIKKLLEIRFITSK